MPSWKIEDTVRLAHIVKEHGVDIFDCSSGGNHFKQKIVPKGGPAYQAPFAEEVKSSVGDNLVVTTVGAITNGHLAQEILDKVINSLSPYTKHRLTDTRIGTSRLRFRRSSVPQEPRNRLGVRRGFGCETQDGESAGVGFHWPRWK